MLCGGHRLEGGAWEHGWFVAPTVFADVDRKMRIAQEEIFGPVVSIIPCDGLENAIDIANDIEYGLSSSIYTKDVNKAFTAMRDLYAGITYINAPTIGAEVHLPFGGTKATGNGHREGGIGAIDFLHGVEVGVHRLFGYAAAGADRSAGVGKSRVWLLAPELAAGFLGWKPSDSSGRKWPSHFKHERVKPALVS